MTAEQLDAYTTVFRIQEITQKLQCHEILPVNRSRSPSPEPEYDQSGRRTNTRQQRHLKSLHDERHGLVQTAIKTIPNYRPPPDYRRPSSFSEKVYVPVKDYPGVNFIGQILGPRGSSLKALNAKSGACIVLRGKGSVKEGRGQGSRSRAAADHLGEPLHCLITSPSLHNVNKAKELVQDVIATAASTPEHENDRKRQQLCDLAVINGTFRDDENLGAQNSTSASRLITFTDGASSVDEPSTASSQLKAQPHGVDDSVDVEIERLLADIDSTPEGAGAVTVSKRAIYPLPPWRVGRM
ncbi:hypothetical protein G6O67_006409 [Ophiocordyceps sinensis]|uniref:Branchpoint-bridging protein n=1 Tax=Ophiocordyceps sinensis TaxID=72228 RepID=A0A8H4LW42_9HYPO|nr:hypothetical protein G6O67_006409 [Ophiocordyceps sinensis]